MKKFLAMVLGVTFACTAFFAGCGGSDKIEIVVDGGGVAGNYNSSINMNVSAANPNPYNYLEQLAQKWESESSFGSKYKIKINRNSINGNRDTILSYVSTKSGPDILYQTGTTIAEDMENDYFVDVTDYLAEPNPYVSDNVKWSDLYNEQELEASRAPNGSFYSVGIDRNVAGFMYNKKIFVQAGITEVPKTYGELISALETIAERVPNVMPVSFVDQWYDIVLEGCMYGEEALTYDVIRANGVVDSEELARASYLGKYRLKNGANADSKFTAYLNIINKLRDSEFTDTSSVGNTAVTEFMKGNIAVVSCLGKSMVQAQRQANAEIVEVGAFGYPILTNDDVDTYGGVTDKIDIGNKGVRRGISGIGTGWWISSAAVKKQTVAACVDFLQYVTAPQNNVPMVNKLGYAIPLDTESAVTAGDMNTLFTDMITQYNKDVEDGYYEFHIFNTWGIMDFDYWSKFVVQSKNLFTGSSDVATVINELNSQFLNSRDSLISTNTATGAWSIENWESIGA